ncbi:MAG: hypothetical protein AVO34_09880 [Firmicutes bacterium ML8_F2]|nr:MAG: hypothetical protein AVO34_09880 [Firmicutes bacterium ML8_F2]
MRKRWLWVLLVFVFVLLVVTAGLIYRTARRGLPETRGNIKADIEKSVEIYRDQYGVPHIIASTMEDLFFAQGYVQAQDRLWQMDMSRRGVSGRLSEILGEDYVETDLFTLTVGFKRAAEKNYELLEQESLALLEAYSAGVNAYIEDNHNHLSPEFALLGYSPAPWTPQDSLSIAVYMSWYLGSNMDSELFHMALIEQVGLDLAQEIFPDYPAEGPIIAPAIYEDIFPKGREAPDPDILDPLIALMQLTDLKGETSYVPGLGSNNWVISGELAPGRGAILANDMHLGMGLPSIWHASHLILEEYFNVTGVMFPGIPGIIVGFNEHIAWGVTNTGPDVQDLYILEFNTNDPTQYLYMEEWIDADLIIEYLPVKGEEEPRQVEVMITRFGPVVSSVVDLEIPLALRWTALEGTREFEALPGLMRAHNWEQFTDALENFMTPTQNFVYADREGNIGYRANGLIPIRSSGDGLLPADGTSDQYEWLGYIPWDELPTLYNPPEGIIVTANHRVVDDDYPYFITYSWAPPYRAMGIWRELEGRNKLDFVDIIRAQTSFFNTQAETLNPVLLTALQEAELNELQRDALTIFEQWLETPVEEAGEAGPAIYNMLYLQMIEHTFADEMCSDLYERFLSNRAGTNAFDRMLLNGESGWFNNVVTAEKEERNDIIVSAFKSTVENLQDLMGSEPSQWRWGELHTITLEHNLGSVALLRNFYNRGPYPVGGSFNTPASMSYQMPDPYGVTHSAPWRYMVDMSEQRGMDVLAGGNSGHFLSEHYNDQTEMWLAGEYKEMIFKIEEVRQLEEKITLTSQ